MAEDHRAHVDAWLWHLRGWQHAGRIHEPVDRGNPADRDVSDGRRPTRKVERIPDVLVKTDASGATVWRWVGKAGASYPAHPLDAVRQRLERAHQAQCAKVDRVARLPLVTGRAAVRRRASGAETAGQVLELAALPEYISKAAGMAGIIARRLGLSTSQVRRILAKARKTRTSEKAGFTPADGT